VISFDAYGTTSIEGGSPVKRLERALPLFALFGLVSCSKDNDMVPDTTPPSVVSATVTSFSHITVAFNEAVDPVTGGTEANYEVFETATPAVTVAVDSASVSGSNVLLVTHTALGSNPYSVRVHGVQDLAGNAMGGIQSIALGTQTLTARGQYLVEHVMACGDCHTPRLTDGSLDPTKKFAGAFFTDIVPNDPSLGDIYAPNLTPDSTGLRNWTNAQIRDAFLNGRDDEGGALFPIMPYWAFHNLKSEDADAIVSYLRSLQAVHNVIPERQPLGFPFTTPAAPIPENRIPHTTLASNDPNYASAERGRYLAGASVCIDCHTVPAEASAVPVKLDSLFAGGRGFEFGPPFPDVIFSANITPDDSTGIGQYTAEQISPRVAARRRPPRRQALPANAGRSGWILRWHHGAGCSGHRSVFDDDRAAVASGSGLSVSGHSEAVGGIGPA
jgi:mono/diheme cytochrome c family protein